MATISYHVTIGSEGRPTVAVTADDPQAARAAIPWLTQTYATLLKAAKAVPTPASTLVKEHAPEAPPLCAVHQVPLIRMHGRTGPFWCCHEKLPTGAWCAYKPR
jgi:hypothetical protein